MNVVGVIPARYASKRLPGKSLVPLMGKPLLQWVLEGVSRSRRIKEWIVATDSELISRKARTLGFPSVMTRSDISSGSERVWATIKDKNVDLVINVQGDEPLIQGEDLDSLVELFKVKKHIEMATLAHETNEEDLYDLTRAKIVLNSLGEALYFSRFPIPFSRFLSKCSSPSSFLESFRSLTAFESLKSSFFKAFKKEKKGRDEKEGKRGKEERGDFVLTHIGVYAYKKSYLKFFCSHGSERLEEAEGLEQLRALDLGTKIHVVKALERTLSVDTEEDRKKVELWLRKKFKKEEEGVIVEGKRGYSSGERRGEN